jgi:hypothetical protein
VADLTSILQTGSATTRVDITFVAEGYLASERDKFLADAGRFTDYILNANNAALNAPFSNFKNYFNANALFVASNQSRWDVTSGMTDTYFKAKSYLEDNRLVYGDTAKVFETVNAALPTDARDITIVLVNSKAYGGAGGPVAWATTGNLNSAEILLHELGHTIAQLGDEYLDPALGGTPLTQPLNLANVTSVKDAPPWQAWMGYEDELGKIGVYEGGYYRATGVWRATQDSKMLHLGKPFNAPQKEALALSFYGKIGDYLKLDTSIPGLCFADVPDSSTLAYTWSRNGTVLANGATDCLDLYGSGLYSAGTSISLSTVDASGLIRTGLSKTQQTETLSIRSGAVDMKGGAVDIAQGGSLFRFDGSSNAITVRDGVSGAYFDGGGGADTVVLNAAFADLSVKRLESGTWVLSRGDDPVFALRNVEFLQFKDQTQALIETVKASAANDTLLDRATGNLVEGGAGTDVLAYAGARAGFSIAQYGARFTVTELASGVTDIVDSVERLRFSDATVALDIAGTAGQAYRLYQAAFDRTPGSTELGYWIGVMDQGVSLREVSAGFTGSAEFKTAYGADPANALVVEKLYQNILNRAGEPAGVAYWLDILNTGKETVAGVLASFSESAENQAAVAELIGNGFAYTPYA